MVRAAQPALAFVAGAGFLMGQMSALTDQIKTDFQNCFLNADEFAIAATYTPAGGSGSSITVLFNEADIVEDETGAIVNAPTALADTDDMSAAKRNDTLVISGTTYYILQARKQEGRTFLILSEHEVI